jgi:hypothetical protein
MAKKRIKTKRIKKKYEIPVKGLAIAKRARSTFKVKGLAVAEKKEFSI